MSEQNEQLLRFKDIIVEKFTREHWLELGLLTGSQDYITGHSRLLRSLDWGDGDYPGNVLGVLIHLCDSEPSNRAKIESYLNQRFPGTLGINISTEKGELPIVFCPSVFKVPKEPIQENLVSVMMPFEASFHKVYETIQLSCEDADMKCQRADDIWVESVLMQDIFRLIYLSSIVVVDFTGKNPNVLYETGIAHTLGKRVIPVTQHKSDIPFDLGHHRFLLYLPNGEGLSALRKELKTRLCTLRAIR